MKTYIYQQKNWPAFTWDHETLHSTLGKVRNMQGKLLGKMESLSPELRDEANLETLTLDILKSSEIEKIFLNSQEVRSSIARHLEMNISGLINADNTVDSIVNMKLDSTQQYTKPLTTERLFTWQSALFPSGISGKNYIIVGNWRNDSSGPLKVISDVSGKDKVTYQAPPAITLVKEMISFIDWFNNETKLDPVIKAGIAHLWFITLHPFEDGSGRIARALTDMLLARADGNKQRFYSLSAQININRAKYFSILAKTQMGSLDITEWLQWYLNCLSDAITKSNQTLSTVLFKDQFWKKQEVVSFNKRQIKILNLLYSDFNDKLNTSTWAKLAECSSDSALRDIQDLMNRGILRKTSSGGRSTCYELNDLNN